MSRLKRIPITFIFAGAEDWHTRIKDRMSPLVGNVKPFYLKAAAPAEVENYLLGVPLRQSFPDTHPASINAIIQQVLDWTGGKPYYVQAIGSRIATPEQFIGQHREALALQVQEETEPQLADFYDKVDAVTRKILVLLSHQPGLSVRSLARRLGLSRQTVWDRVSDLEVLDKVRPEGGEYRIVGTLIAAWGKRNRDLPAGRRWPQQLLRWSGTLVACAASVWTFGYTPPASQSVQFPFANGTVRLTFPASVEAGEQGTLNIAVRNTGQTVLADMSMTVFSAQIDFYKDGSSRIPIKDLGGGETRHVTMSYRVHATGARDTIPLEVAVRRAASAATASHEVLWHLRRWPLKRWWALISPSLLVLSAALQWNGLKSLLDALRLLIGGGREPS